MRSPGLRTFLVASVFLVLMGVMHGIAQFTSRATTPAGVAIEASMRSYHQRTGR